MKSIYVKQTDYPFPFKKRGRTKEMGVAKPVLKKLFLLINSILNLKGSLSLYRNNDFINKRLPPDFK